MYLSGGITDKEHRRAYTQRQHTAIGDCGNGLCIKHEGTMMEKLSSQERMLEEIKILFENHTTGLSNKELAERIGTSETNVCRDLAIFGKYKWISRGERGRWRLSAEFGGIAGQIMKSYKTARLELSRDEERYMSAMQ